jgi:hypothetical protein
MQAVEVSSWFDATQVLSDLECYTLLAERVVVAQSGFDLATIIYQSDERLLCDCPRFRQTGECGHVQALGAGLWGRLRRGRSLLVRTRDWCKRSATHLESRSVYSTVPSVADGFG